MSKELEALEMIVVDLVPEARKFNMEEIKLVKSALERLENIEVENAELKSRNEKLEMVVDWLKDCRIRREIDVCEDLAHWNYDEYVALPCSKLFNEFTFNLLKEMLEEK